MHECDQCGRKLPTAKGLDVHVRLVHPESLPPQEPKSVIVVSAVKRPGITVSSTGDQSKPFQKGETQDSLLGLLTRLRLVSLMPVAQIQFVKDGIKQFMQIVSAQLTNLLKPHVVLSDVSLAAIVNGPCDVLQGLETLAREKAILHNESHLKSFLLYKRNGESQPTKRILGTRIVSDARHGDHTTDDFCVDLPVEKTLERLLHTCPRAVNEILATCRRTHDRAHSVPHYNRADAEKDPNYKFSDIHDGHGYREHEVFGDEFRRKIPTHTADASAPSWIPLCIGMYADEVEPNAVLGAFRVNKKIMCFYYMIFDLSPSSRQSVLFIIPFTFAFGKDCSRYGSLVLAGDPTSLDYATCSSGGASMARLANGIEMEFTYNSVVCRVWIYAYLLVFMADHPAAAQFGCWKRSTSAASFDRRSYVDHNDPEWRCPSSNLDANADLPQKWELRTEESLKEDEAQFNRLLLPGTATATTEAFDFLAKRGIHHEKPFNFPLKHFMWFRVFCSMVQDIMHNLLEGSVSTELAAFLFLCIRHSLFTLL